MIIRGIVVAIITFVIGGVLSAIIMPLLLPADALEQSAEASVPVWCIISIVVGVFFAIKHKKRMRQLRRSDHLEKAPDTIVCNKKIEQ